MFHILPVCSLFYVSDYMIYTNLLCLYLSTIIRTTFTFVNLLVISNDINSSSIPDYICLIKSTSLFDIYTIIRMKPACSYEKHRVDTNTGTLNPGIGKFVLSSEG